jgi:hypothetical protein
VTTVIVLFVSHGACCPTTQVVCPHSSIVSVARGGKPVPTSLTVVLTITLFGLATMWGGVGVGVAAPAAPATAPPAKATTANAIATRPKMFGRIMNDLLRTVSRTTAGPLTLNHDGQRQSVYAKVDRSAATAASTTTLRVN